MSKYMTVLLVLTLASQLLRSKLSRKALHSSQAMERLVISAFYFYNESTYK